jgi:hypothetical protein
MAAKLAIAIMPKPGDGGTDDNPAPNIPDGNDDDGGGMDQGVGELCLPQEVVATADEKDEKVAPEVGDEVRFDCVAKVTRVEGGNVYVSPTEVNGQEVGDQNEPDEEKQGPEPDSEKSMRDLAQQADSGAGGY